MSKHENRDSVKRFEVLLEHLEITTAELAKMMGLKRADKLYHIQHGRNGISREVSKSISSVFPQINENWLCTGEGEMILKDSRKNNPTQLHIMDDAKGASERINNIAQQLLTAYQDIVGLEKENMQLRSELEKMREKIDNLQHTDGKKVEAG